ncbi:HPr-rel-A system PqqD family peptide chaperone [Thiorhodococcus mannitoliphagus]|uniref:HPr-rel-A system PqqD family peptide chaperone n=2 Tax=Thiorhodococcus mannitoliphagus TaxID=329406 RepID=A0A6P1DYT3_9GAMM|nr:HPr-rel-A system PqqD family peptide chaperone [Thiorhodococcus mannitoliphagus]
MPDSALLVLYIQLLQLNLSIQTLVLSAGLACDLMIDRQVRYQISACSLVDVAWENEHLVYCVDSGETHFLNATGAQILDYLIASPLSFEDLLACITSVDDGSNSETSAADLSSFLDRFVELGILVSCPALSDA